ncbi:MAG TPA: lamin tail domain-containing protein [Polyangiaceae bacterium]|nr:lamin tail domain-containing protein [Polyangiaceae bacterium]
MKRWHVKLGALSAVGLLGAHVAGCGAAEDGAQPESASALGSANVVISQVFGGGGASGAPFAADYIELFNRGSAPVSLSGWSVQYASSTGSSWLVTGLSGTIQPGGYYLVQESNSSSGAALPAADAQGSTNLSATKGKVALVTNQTALGCSTSCTPSAAIVDFVGYGGASSFEGSASAPTPSNTTAVLRAGAGCTDTDNNASDFSAGTAAPRHASSASNACNGQPPPPPPADAGSGTDSGPPDSGGGNTGGGTSDGTPTRQQCTGNFGAALSTSFARLDGFLVSIIQPGQGSSCNGDANHVHLQVLMKGGIYDVAVNVDSNQGTPNVNFEKLSAPLADGAWSEGWHTADSFDYVNTLGAHSGDFPSFTPSQLAQEVTNDLATVNHISVFMTGYSGAGGHLIHRNATNQDGAIVTQPLSSNPQYLLFHFANQTF